MINNGKSAFQRQNARDFGKRRIHMKNIKTDIIGKKIKSVFYSEINHTNGQFYFEGFDTFDHNLNVEMENGVWWNLSWKNEEYFEFGIDKYDYNDYLNNDKIKSWDATERWEAVLDSAIINFRIAFIDEAGSIPSTIEIEFQNKKKIKICIAEELNLDKSIPFPFEYNFGGEIYVFHDERLLNQVKNTK